MSVYRRILHAVDLSEDSAALGRRAQALASTLGAEIELLHVVEFVPVEPMGETLMPAVQIEEQLMQSGGTAPQGAARGARHRRGVLPSRSGNVKTEIVRIARERHTDLIVIGSRERHGLPYSSISPRTPCCMPRPATCSRFEWATPARRHGKIQAMESLEPKIRVDVETSYVPEQSDPAEPRYVFSYTITIRNEGHAPARLLRRHWIITDANGKVQEVRGDGVVGEQPYLKPGEGFRYSSGTVIETPVGVMQGSYQMVADDGNRFDAPIAPFRLAKPGVLQ